MHSAAPSANISPLLEGSDMFSAGKMRKDNMVFSIKNNFIPKPMEISKSSIFINLKITDYEKNYQNFAYCHLLFCIM